MLYKSADSQLFIDGAHEVYRYRVPGLPWREKRRPISGDGSVLLSSGVHGSTFKPRPGVLTATNQVRFRCAHCGRTLVGATAKHAPGCTHPWAGRG